MVAVSPRKAAIEHTGKYSRSNAPTNEEKKQKCSDEAHMDGEPQYDGASGGKHCLYSGQYAISERDYDTTLQTNRGISLLFFEALLISIETGD